MKILLSEEEYRGHRHISTAQVIILGFLAVILLGALLLTLPFATQGKPGASFLDALFTSTSALCVTGLVVKDTATYWSTFGQSIILLLIQIGGMGVVTVALALFLLSGKRINLKERQTMQASISAPKVGGILRFTLFIVKSMAILETLGAAVMAPVFIRDFGFGKGLFYAFFHSISAFCNAGFDLMGAKDPGSSLCLYEGNVVINLCIMSLIVVGGIGFLTWDDLCEHRLHAHRWQMQTKVILTTTLILIVAPALLFFFRDFAGEPLKMRFLKSFFQSVTTRTAGFNTVDLGSMSQVSQLVMILLMLIGGSPGSTAGGMKNTTLAVVLFTSISVFRRHEYTHFYGRRLSSETLRTASTIFFMYISLSLTGGLLLAAIDGVDLLPALFEASSALGTVGLSLGITAKLGAISKLILVFLMYIGRVGGLTLIFATLMEKSSPGAKFPEERLTVG